MNDITLPPRNTTTASLYFTSAEGAPRLDATFTVRGQLHGAALSEWLHVLISEHGNEDLNATIDVWHHDAQGDFDHSEITSTHYFA